MFSTDLRTGLAGAAAWRFPIGNLAMLVYSKFAMLLDNVGEWEPRGRRESDCERKSD